MSFNKEAVYVECDHVLNRIVTSLIVANPDTHNHKEINGIWDTGSNKSIINTSIVEELDLPYVGKGSLSNLYDKKDTDIWNIDILLCLININIDVFSSDLRRNDFDMVIGMDIISKGDFIITNYDGKTTMSFRCPSKQNFNFIDHNIVPKSTK